MSDGDSKIMEDSCSGHEMYVQNADILFFILWIVLPGLALESGTLAGNIIMTDRVKRPTIRP